MKKYSLPAIGFDRQNNKIIYILFVLFLGACEFQPSDIPESFVEKPSDNAPLLEIELEPATDTLYLFESVKIKYRFKAAAAKLHWVEFYFDGELVSQKQQDLSKLLEMDLYIENYGEGNHRFEIKVFVSSGSGSIADRVGAEGYLYQLVWPVVIDRTSRTDVKITGVEAKPGGTLVKWEKFKFASFEEYRLRKVSFFDAKEELIKINDQDKTDYFDGNYLEGENVYYSINVNGGWNNGVYFTQELEPLQATGFQNYSGEISWQPSQNPDRLDYYRLYEGSNSERNEKRISYEDGARFSVDKLPFGSNKQFNIQYVPKTYNSNHSFSMLAATSVVVGSGEKIPSFEVTKPVAGTSKSLYSNGNKIVLFDHQSRSALDSLDFGLAELRAYRLSMDGKIVYTLVDNELTMWEIDGFKNLGAVDITQIDQSLSGIYAISVSSDFRILFTASNWNLVLYDFQDKKVILKTEENLGLGYISPNGNFVLTSRSGNMTGTIMKYYRIKGSELEFVGDPGPVPYAVLTNFYFSSTEINQVIVRIGDQLEICDATSFQRIKTVQISNSFIVLYDSGTNNLIYEKENGSESGESYLIQLPGENIKDTVYLNSSNVVLHGNYLIGRNGRQLDLNML